MINSMFDVMARINELKSRFGLTGNSKDNSLKNASSGNSFSGTLNEVSGDPAKPLFHHDRAVSKDEIEKIISFHSEKKGVSSDLVNALVKAGSGYNSEAVSPDGAIGLMQLRPATFDKLGITDPFNPEENVEGGVTLLSDLLKSYSGDYRKALEAYTAAGRNQSTEGINGDHKNSDYAKRIIDYYVKDSD
jgi:soluble lytic murein transglycosylase-like protein